MRCVVPRHRVGPERLGTRCAIILAMGSLAGNASAGTVFSGLLEPNSLASLRDGTAIINLHGVSGLSELSLKNPSDFADVEIAFDVRNNGSTEFVLSSGGADFSVAGQPDVFAGGLFSSVFSGGATPIFDSVGVDVNIDFGSTDGALGPGALATLIFSEDPLPKLFPAIPADSDLNPVQPGDPPLEIGVTITIIPLPVPAPGALAVATLAGLAVARRRR